MISDWSCFTGWESQLTARDNLRTVETEMVRPGAAALTVYHDEWRSEGSANRRKGWRTGRDRPINQLGLFALWCAVPARHLWSCLDWRVKSWRAPFFFCANYGQVRKEQATKYVRPSTISIMIMNWDISDGDFNESVALLPSIFAKAGNARY